jgi:IS5 family transposase
MAFDNFFIQQAYERVKKLGDPLIEFDQMIDWERFRPIISQIFADKSQTGGRPNTDEVQIMKILFLQALYNLSDPQLEYQLCDRLSFRHFTGIQEEVPDFTTIWKIRNKLKKRGIDVEIWEELQDQLDEQGFEIESGTIQDAAFIHSDVGKKRHHKEKKAKKNEENGSREELPSSSQIDRDASFSIKNGQVHHGYKDHVKVDIDHGLVRDFYVTTASVHDSEIDLATEGDVAMYRDKGYFGVPILAEGVLDKTMKRATRKRKLNGGEQNRNRCIARIRSPGERVFSVVKGVFNGWYTNVKTIDRVMMKSMMKYFAFNVYQLRTLQRRKLALAMYEW